ncbi:hypothetical protein K2173_015223 [Erythroxylum novogranatense]|uniref:Retrovirus-related Pol polyprotein from transposon TNT 1-94-like beta-barrel domain-containing protein n=1 Tax=Erythroxylum novogranatense TaxID=1862640 RepID=A0AAV8T1B0_9ROSI|nr:hypothetical protein K2173_015223 [Erythroxylum novogranatense]
MKTLLRSQHLWNLVEYGFVDILEPNAEEEERLNIIKQKDAKALFIIQQAVHETIFSRIAAATTSQQAWSILQKEFQGDSKFIMVKLQSLRRDFETLVMKNGELIADFFSRTMTISNQMRSYGEQISDETIVAKVLRSLTPKFDNVVAAIEEAKDLSVLSIDELMGSLQAHESRINRVPEKNEEKAFQVQEETIHHGDNDSLASRGRDQQMNFTAEDEEEDKLFMACIDSNSKPRNMWFVDSGCSNHMIGRIKVQLGNKREMQVEGKGTVNVNTRYGKVKELDNVQFILELEYNLLSVGQLMAGGYSLLFDDNACVITNKR